MTVRLGYGAYRADVGVRCVVAQDCRVQVLGPAEISRSGAEIDRGCRGGVGHVLRVLDLVAIGIGAGDAPGAGDELHRPHGPVVHVVPVQSATVAVGDPGGPVRTVERDADDAWSGHPCGVQTVARKAGMVALDASDGSRQRPVDVAARIG